MTIFVTASGDTTRIDTWGGLPWHLVEALREASLPAHGVSLTRPPRALGLFWNGWQAVTTGGRGGFQYAPLNLEWMWHRAHADFRGNSVINCFQLYPRSIVEDPAIRRFFYIDATLIQLFRDYDPFPGMAASTRQRILMRERDGYASAQAVICHSHWAARSVIEDVGIDPARVHVVVPGANIPARLYGDVRRQHRQADNETGALRLIFTGRNAHRKGLDRLLAALPIAAAAGAECALTVIGCKPEAVAPSLRDVAGVTWLGLIDKGVEGARFLELLASAEVGCLLSRQEFGGIGQREYAAAGLVIMGPDVGGAPEHAGATRSVMVAPDATPEDIARVLAELAMRGPLYQRLRAAADATRKEALYPATIAQLRPILGL